MAGFRMIQVKAEAEAVESVKRRPAVNADDYAEIEFRAVFEAGAFGPESTSDPREAEEQI